MRKSTYFALVAGVILASAANGVGSRQPTTAGSFLQYRANSASELAAITRNNSKICARYATHFGTTMSGVENYFSSHLRLVRLKKATTTTVYYISSSGGVGQSRRILPAGTLAFVNETGQPVLDWRCGNPLTSALPSKLSQSTRKLAPLPKAGAMAAIAAKAEGATEGTAVAAAPLETTDQPAEAVTEKVLGAAPVEFIPTVAAQGAMAALPTVPPVAGMLPSIVEATAAPAVAAVGAPPILAAAGGGFSWLWGLAALGGAAGVHAIAGNTGSTPPEPPIQPVPEPGMLVPFAMGFSATCGVALRMRRRAAVV